MNKEIVLYVVTDSGGVCHGVFLDQDLAYIVAEYLPSYVSEHKINVIKDFDLDSNEIEEIYLKYSSIKKSKL